MTPEQYRKEAHERHMTFLATVVDLIDAINDYYESLYRFKDNYTKKEREALGIFTEEDLEAMYGKVEK